MTQTRWVSPWPAPNRHSAQAAALASFSTTTGRPQPAADGVAQRLVAPGQVRREQHRRPRRVDEAGRADADRAWMSCRWPGRATSSTMVSSTTCGLLLGRRLAAEPGRRILAVGVDDAGRHLGAADVDADRQSLAAEPLHDLLGVPPAPAGLPPVSRVPVMTGFSPERGPGRPRSAAPIRPASLP